VKVTLIFFLICLTTGCSTTTFPLPWGGTAQFQNLLAKKQVKSVELVGNTNGNYRIIIRGYGADQTDAFLAGVSAAGAAYGISQGRNPTPPVQVPEQ